MNKRERKRITYITKESLNKKGGLPLMTRFLISKSLSISVSTESIYDNFKDSKILLGSSKNFKVKVFKKKKAL
ncbi:hypothetical protein EAI30_07310 [Romboutsia ilealis]|uniref:Uncharacterized protein n=1 Tax=Romboutsia faecis TaxID=2764597 RepID=A0ABR7JKV6_9FIRM|nr:hypothetical protein [Romboutsia faecis]MBC5995333.1 hypothetical protein [Romboutsia faecis]MRN24421.1 hypothetical protein [Romboutsia ilealis]